MTKKTEPNKDSVDRMSIDAVYLTLVDIIQSGSHTAPDQTTNTCKSSRRLLIQVQVVCVLTFVIVLSCTGYCVWAVYKISATKTVISEKPQDDNDLVNATTVLGNVSHSRSLEVKSEGGEDNNQAGQDMPNCTYTRHNEPHSWLLAGHYPGEISEENMAIISSGGDHMFLVHDVWDLQKFVLPWPTPDMSIHRNIYPAELWTAMKKTPVRYGVFIQVFNNSKEESKWVMELAAQYPFIKGIVGGLDLTNPKFCETLPNLIKDVPLLKGARHVLDNEKSDWITRDDVNAGLAVLANHDLSFDLLVRFVINHIGKPNIKDGKLSGWKEDMAKIAKYPNVFCKISGMVTVNDREEWSVEDFRPYVQHVLDVFTPDRCMFGSDWPVFTMLGAKYHDVYGLLADLVCDLGQGDKEKIFRKNAVKFYKLRLDEAPNGDD